MNSKYQCEHSTSWAFALSQDRQGKISTVVSPSTGVCSSIPVSWHWEPARCHTDHIAQIIVAFFLFSGLIYLLPKRKQKECWQDKIKSICIAMELLKHTVDGYANDTSFTEGCFLFLWRWGFFHFKIKCTWILNFHGFLTHSQRVNLSKSFPLIFQLPIFISYVNLAVISSFHICFLAKHRAILYWAITPN